MYPPAPSKGGPWGWIISFIGIGLFAAVVFAVLVISRGARHLRDDMRRNGPPTFTTGGNTTAPGDVDFGEDGATVSSGSTTITRTFDLENDATISLANINGDITVEGWDQQKAQVTITKTGGTQDMRSQAKVAVNSDDDKLTLKVLRGSPSGIAVKYDVKLPRGLDKATITSTNGTIKISSVEGNITAESQNGSLHLVDVKGGAKVKTTNGAIDAVFDSVDDDDPMEFYTVNGSIRLQFNSDLNARLSAETTAGAISVDGFDGVSIEKRLVGQRASGNIGDGGRPLNVKTTNGSISITKQAEAGDSK